MIKRSIQRLGLIKTGRMYNSIDVTESYDGYEVDAVYYFAFHNWRYDIVSNVLESQELKEFIEDYLIKKLESELDKED